MSSSSEARQQDLWRLIHLSLLCGFVLLVLAGISVFRSLHIMEGNSDFVANYSAARLVRQHGASNLYNLELQRAVQKEVLQGGTFPGGLLPYTHPPFELLLFAPFGYLSYRSAFILWSTLNGLSLLMLPWAMSRTALRSLKSWRKTILFAAMSFYPFAVCLWVGQDSIVYLWLVVSSYLLLKRRNEFWAGVVIGLSFFRFQTSALLIAPLLFHRRWSALAGLLSCLSGLWVISWGLVGTSGLTDYWNFLRVLSSNPDGMEIAVQERMMNWAGQLSLLGAANLDKPQALVILGSVGLFCIHLLWVGKWQPGGMSFGLQFGATVLVSLLASPHHYMYDLSAAFLPAMLFLEHMLGTHGASRQTVAMGSTLITFPWALFLSLPIARFLQVQLGVLWMTLMFCFALAQIRSNTNLARQAQPE
jgi:hypothetical protein